MTPHQRNAMHFFNAWKNLARRAEEAYADYLVAEDIVSLMDRPDPKEQNTELIKTYHTLHQRLRYYKQRWVSINQAAIDAMSVWEDITKG